MKNKFLQFLSSMRRGAAMLLLLLTWVTHAWAYTIIRNGELYGSGGWSNSETMTQVGSTNVYYKTYNSPTATTDLIFRIGTGSEWETAQGDAGIDNTNSNIVMVATGRDKNIKFQVPTSVPVTIYYNSSTKKIWIKVDSYKTDVLNGKEMFYYGFTKNWSGDFAHFYDNGTRKFGSWAATSYADGSAKLAIGVYDVSSSTNYSASHSDSWSGVNHEGMAAGCQIQTYSVSSTNYCYYNDADQFSFDSTSYTIVVGQTIASFPSISLTSKQSGADADLSLEGYYYSTATSGQAWNVFTPGTTESSLAAGTYYIKAIATDGAIYMASTNYITLTVNSAPVLGVANATSVTSNSATFNATATLNSNTTSSYGFKYGAGASYDTKAELISGGTTASTSGALDASTFSKNVTGLSASTTYYYISYAVVNGTTYYSDAVKSFTTSAAATYNLSVVAGTGISAVTGSTNNISANQSIAITATVATGYTWSTWTKTGAGTLSTFTAGTKDQTVKVGAVGNMTLTASATENMSSLTTSNSYNAGNPSYAIPTKSASSIGISTTATLTATTPSTGYTFAGWTLSDNLVVTSGDKDNDLSITVRTNGNGAAASAQANYNEVLTSTYYLVGNNLAVFPGDATWAASDSKNMLRKASGSSTGSVGSITINVKSIPANSSDYQFKIHESSANKWWGWSNEYYYWMDATKTTSLYDNQHNLYFIPNALGDYTFSVNWSNASEPSLTVTFPATTYTVNFGQGAGTEGTASATYSSTAFTSGTKVQNGKSITLSAPAAMSGKYNWDGWYNASSGGSKVSSDNPLTTTVSSSNHDFYARYTEITHTVTLSNGGHGHVEIGGATVTSVSGVGYATASGTITAVPDPGYYFTGWTGAINSGVTLASGTTSSASITINATADSKTITAHFQPRFGLIGSVDADGNPDGGMPGWDNNYAADFTVVGYTNPGVGDAGIMVDLQCARTLNPNTRYKFRVYDREKGVRRACSSDYVLPAEEGKNNWQLDKTSNDVHIQTVGRGTYTFHITRLSNDDNNYPSLQVERQASWQVSIGQGFADIDGTITSNSSTGGTMAAEATESGIKVGITNGLYIANGGKLDFKATPATGYSFEGWHSSSALTSPFATANPSNIASVTAAANVYVKFVENSTAVTIAHNEHGHVTVGGETATSTTVGITTTRALVAVPDAGYYFAGWTVPVGADFELQGNDDEEDAEVTLHGLGAGTAGTLTANFVEEDKIYFRNIDQSTGEKLWDKDHIYVYFGTTWYDGKGVQTLSNYAEMSPFGSTKIYWAYVPHAFTKSKNTHVAFSDVDMHSNSEFYNNKGVYRTDYSRITNMFVPHHTTSGPTNGTVYHSNGYWKVFDPQIGVGQGYYLQLHTGVDGEGKGTYDEKGEFTAVANGSSKIAYTMRVDNTFTQRTYRIVSAGGVHYTASTTITSAAYEDVTVNEYNNCSNCYFEVTPTSEGDYKFILDQSEDYMKLTVEYPVSTGDYRLKHTYNDGSAKTTYSNVIKSSDASTSRTLSMYLSTEGSETLVLQKCTAIVAGVPAWDAGDAENLGGILTTVETNGRGVYKFDVAVSGDKVSLAPTATKYTGPYYIKTDGANGGWVNYTLNSMTENTINYDPTNHPEESFNYYYCKYYKAEGNNLKCVIANDYCNALTDTLIGDAVIGMGNQTTPSAVSVRFSYNSYTNEIKRSYLGASMEDDFLRIEGDQTASKPHIYDKGESTFDDTHADEYIKFEDKQNWRYEIEINADVNARAKLTASFNDQTQYFMGAAGEFSDANTEQLFGGAGGTYGLTLVYDFKTNKLIRAWKPTGSTISENLTLESDVLLLREHQGAPAEITFGTIGETDVYASLTDVKTVYSVLRFNRWKLSNRAHPEDVDTEHCKTADLINDHHPALSSGADGYLPQAERELYFISFPYDVKMSDIIHFGGYYDTWGIMYYDGKNRAKNGYWIDSESNWKYFTPEEFATDTLNAYEGYLIGIDLDQMRYDNTSFWTNNSSEVDIYFPSKEPVSTITQQAVDVTIDQTGYQCTINREFGGSDGDRRIKDSYWHCIGVPAYANLDHAITGSAPTSWENTSLLYLYKWNTATNDHSIEKASDFSFQAMYAYLVQYAGTTLSWAAAAVSPTTPAARRMKTEELRDRQFNLQLMQGDKETDHTYIRLSDDEEVTTGFEFNHDVSKMMLTGANIYTLIGKEQAAANSLPLNMTQTTVVPVGVKIATAGDYTFAIPEGTDGVGVVLIDNIAGTRTNLALTDYTVSLTTGKIENRFSLEISPIQHTPTGIENAGDGVQDGVRKVVVDGILYIVHDGRIYDARGNRVK